jgi:hypothetical protein
MKKIDFRYDPKQVSVFGEGHTEELVTTGPPPPPPREDKKPKPSRVVPDPRQKSLFEE